VANDPENRRHGAAKPGGQFFVTGAILRPGPGVFEGSPYCDSVRNPIRLIPSPVACGVLKEVAQGAIRWLFFETILCGG